MKTPPRPRRFHVRREKGVRAKNCGWRAETKNLHELPKLSIFDPVHCFSMIALSARRPPCRRAFFSPMAILAKGQARGNGDGRHRRRFLEGAARALARRGGGGGALFVVPLKA
ncbi:MAG: hypothetical protein IH926_05140 [Proteobacteria bacterium]|nr:hypothetical protein [Pseudomonadota bacterium]